MKDSTLAAHIAGEAGRILLTVRADAVTKGLGPAELRTLGDREAQGIIARLLDLHRPQDAILSEEAEDDEARLRRERVWIIDPLDGTREFSEGRADWAVHVALWVAGELVAGAVALPAEGLVLSSDTIAPLPPRREGSLRIAVSRSRPPALAEAVALALGADLVPLGSAGVKAGAVARGHVDAWLHAGGQFEWDSAAPVAVARAAGAYASRIDGSPLLYNQPSPYLPDVVVCRPEVADDMLEAIQNTGGVRDE